MPAATRAKTRWAAKAELAGKAAMLLLSLPLFEKVAELAASLIGGTGAGG